MIEKSPELAAIAARIMDNLNRRDFASIANLFLPTPHGRYIGTDGHEWWHGTDYIAAYPTRQDEMPDYVVAVLEVEGFQAGGVGWAAVRTMTTFSNLEPRSARFTFVFVLESGFWRIVQHHASFEVPNPEVMGVEMTESLEDLLASMRAGADLRGLVRQGTITLLVTDVESSTELAAAAGDERWAEIIDWHDATIRRIVEDCGGTVVKTLGDGAMAAFDSVRGAARSAIAIQRAFAERTEPPELLIRIGLHVGDAVFAEDDFMGSTVNKAARVAAAARGG